MLLPTVLIIAVNLALGFVAAVGRERFLARRAGGPSASAEAEPADRAAAAQAPPSTPPEAAAPGAAETAAPERDGHVAESAAPPQSSDDRSSEAADAPNEDDASQPAAVEAASLERPTNAKTTSAADPSTVPSAERGDTDAGLQTKTPGSQPVREQEGRAHDPQGDQQVRQPRVKPADGRTDEDADDEVDDAPQSVSVAAASASANIDLPPEWFDLLSDIEKEGFGKCQSFVEASTHVLRLEVGQYRGELVRLDARLRAIYRAFDADALAEALADLDALNRDWLVRQSEAVGHLVARRGNLGDLQAAGERLEDVLLDQTAQIETSRSNIRQIDFAADDKDARSAAQRRLTVEICRLVDMAHALRDQLQEALVAILLGENRVATLDRRLHLDPLTGFVNRAGLEAVLYEWWRDDPHRIRQLSLAAFDVARTGRFNERHGVAAGDGLLAAIGKIIDGALRKKRGCDLVARHSGQRFVVLLGDTGPRNATSAAERIRQMITASSFEIDGGQEEVHVSCGVAEVQHDDDSAGVLGRLGSAISLAKKSGRNVTCLDEGRGPAMVEDPPRYEVKSKLVRLELT